MCSVLMMLTMRNKRMYLQSNNQSVMIDTQKINITAYKSIKDILKIREYTKIRRKDFSLFIIVD